MNRRFGAVFLIGAPEGFNDIGAQFRQRGDPGDKAVLEGFGIQGRKQIAERIMGRPACESKDHQQIQHSPLVTYSFMRLPCAAPPPLTLMLARPTL